jgi:excisionase family DNA binding protein
MEITLDLPEYVIDEIADRVADIIEQRARAADEWYSVIDAAAYLRCSKQRIYDLRHDGRLRAHRDGRRLLFRREELDAYLAGPDR